MSRLCRPASFGLAVIAPARGVKSPVSTGVHTLAWTAADECCENPRKKNLVAFGVDEPNSSEPAKGLKQGVCQGSGGGWIGGKRRLCTERAEGDDGLVCWYLVVDLLCPE